MSVKKRKSLIFLTKSKFFWNILIYQSLVSCFGFTSSCEISGYQNNIWNIHSCSKKGLLYNKLLLNIHGSKRNYYNNMSVRKPIKSLAYFVSRSPNDFHNLNSISLDWSNFQLQEPITYKLTCRFRELYEGVSEIVISSSSIIYLFIQIVWSKFVKIYINDQLQ